jgi:acyl-CoA thioesterase I
MPFLPNEQREYHEHEGLRAYQRIHSPRRRLSLILLLAALLAFVAACEPAPQTKAPASALTKTSSQPTFTYVAIGASDSFGIGTDNPASDNWPTALAGLMGPDTHLINLGIPGETVAEARETELPVALDADPTVVTVWLGVNDILQSVTVEDYERGLEAILHALDEHTHAHVFVGNIPDLTALPYFAGFDQQALRAKITRWNAAIDQAIATRGAILVDINASWDTVAQHPEYIASDGLHPSTEGAKQLAAVFLSWIMIVMPGIHTEAGAA